MKTYFFTFFTILCIASSSFAETDVSNYFPKSGIVGKDLEVQLEGNFDKKPDVMLMASPETCSVIGSVEILYTTTYLEDNMFLSGVVVENNFAYVLLPQYGFYIINIKNEAHPKITGFIKINDGALLTIINQFAYIMDIPLEKVSIINVKDPSHPHLVGCIHNFFYNIHVSFPYISKSNHGVYWSIVEKIDNQYYFKIFDISSHQKAKLCGSYLLPINLTNILKFTSLFVRNDIAYILIGCKGDQLEGQLLIVDIHDPEHIKLISCIDNAILYNNLYMFPTLFSPNPAFRVDEQNVFIAGSGGLKIFDISNPISPDSMGSVAIGASHSPLVNPPFHRLIVNNHIATDISTNMIQIIDISDLANPRYRGNIFTDSIIYSGTVKDNRAYLLDTTVGVSRNDFASMIRFKIIDLSIPKRSKIRNIGNLITPVCAKASAIDRNTEIIASHKGFHIIDNFNRIDPKLIGFVDIPIPLTNLSGGDFKSHDNKIYIASEKGISIVDLKNFFKPEIESIHEINIDTGEISKQDAIRPIDEHCHVIIENVKNKLYYSNKQGFSIIDLQNSASPEIFRFFDNIDINTFSIVDSKAYIAGYNFYIVDILDEKKVHIISSTNWHSQPVTDLYIANNKAYILFSDALQIFDIADSAHPKILGDIAIPAYQVSLAVYENKAYLTDSLMFITIIDIYDPSSMKITGRFKTLGQPLDINVHNNMLYIEDWAYGFTSFPLPEYPKVTHYSPNNLLLRIPSPQYPGTYKLNIDDGLKTKEIALFFDAPFLLSEIHDQTISPEIKEAVFSLSITATCSNTTIENYTVSGHAGIQQMIPDQNISVSMSEKKVIVKIKPQRHQYGTTPIHITVSDGHASLVETFNLTVKLPQLCFQHEWSGKKLPEGIVFQKKAHVIDIDNFMFHLDKENHCIVKFNSDNDIIDKWGCYGTDIAQFKNPSDIAIDTNGFLYVADTGNHRIQVFTSYGEFITLFGEHGHQLGQFDYPNALSIDKNNLLYVNDSKNNRIQAFQKVDYTEGKTKAVIVAGGGNGDNIWSAIKTCANFAYQTLISQGLNKEDIHFLSSDKSIHPDSHDMVDSYATNSNIKKAIEKCTSNETGSFVLYLVDHGLSGAFKTNENEMLLASTLNAWLNIAQEMIPGKLIIIYDACYSSSFIKTLSNYSPNRQRIIITSSGASEKSRFDARGSAAFSSHFWSAIFNGHDIQASFESARDAIISINNYQHPHVDANGDGKTNTPIDLQMIQNVIIGNGTFINCGIPLVKKVWTSPEKKVDQGNSVNIHVSDIYSQNGISQVWAVITPPYTDKEVKKNDIKSMHSIELCPMFSSKEYVGQYNGLSMNGTYRIAVFVKDNNGIISKPAVANIEVNNNIERKSIIISNRFGKQAYNTLKFQGYTDDNIYYYSSNKNINGVDGIAHLNSLEQVFDQLQAYDKDSELDLVMYMAGGGDASHFYLNKQENLSIAKLNTWLSKINGMVTVIYDAPFSWDFLESLTFNPHQKRILISGSSKSQTAHFLLNGTISFSRFFWDMILYGKSVLNAQKYSRTALSFLSRYQTSCIVMGKALSKNYYIGNAYIPGNTIPVIETATAEKSIENNSIIKICATVSTSSHFVKNVWAFIQGPRTLNQVSKNPVTHLPHVVLTPVPGDEKKYTGQYDTFDKSGEYSIGLFVMNTDGNMSFPFCKSFVWSD